MKKIRRYLLKLIRIIGLTDCVASDECILINAHWFPTVTDGTVGASVTPEVAWAPPPPFTACVSVIGSVSPSG